MTAQSYCNFLNATAVTADSHHLYTDVMAASPLFYTKILFNPIKKNVDSTTFPPSLSYSLSGTNPNIPAVGIDLRRAARYINWYNNGHPDPATTEFGTYIISENPKNDVPPGGFSASYPSITLDSDKISAAIIKDNNDRLTDPTKPALTMVFLASEPVLYSFDSDVNGAYLPTGSDSTRDSFSYFWEWTPHLVRMGIVWLVLTMGNTRSCKE